MVVQPRKHDPEKLRVCVDYRWLNKDTKTDNFPTPFYDEILNEVAGHQCYLFTDGFSRDYKDLKGLVEIDLLLETTPIKKRPYKLAHKYKEIVKTLIDNMLTA